MLKIHAAPARTCQGLTRRDLLQAGGLGLFGLSLPQLLQSRAQAAVDPRRSSTFGKARSCLIVFLNGGPSHHAPFDMNPDAPAEIRGEFEPIQSSVPGIHVCEHLPRTARVLQHCTLVRSMSHENTDHVSATYWLMTGGHLLRPVIQASGMARNDRPHLGAILARELGSRN